MEPRFHSVSLVSEKCKGCTNCIKRCPTEAIRVRDGKANIDAERCIDCGECIRNCENHAKQAVGDSLELISAYKYRIALLAPALLGQFKKEIPPAQILGAFLQLGFHRVAEAGYGADFTTVALREYLKSSRARKPLISSACPAVVKLIQVRFPALIANLAPIEAPMVTAAKLARKEAVKEDGISSPEIGVFFITPCPAKITVIKGGHGIEDGIINGAIPISQIFGGLQSIILSGKAQKVTPRLSKTGVSWSRAGGEIKAVGIDNQLSVDGIHNVVNVLEEVEMDKLTEVDFIEAQACTGGCIGGALTVENPFTARMKIQRLVEGENFPPLSHELIEEAAQYYFQGFFNWDYQVTPKPILPLDRNVAQAIQKIEQIEEVARLLPGLDCGSCGSPNCRALAEDIVQGKAQTLDCVFKLREEVSKLAQDLLKLSQRLPPAMGISNAKQGGKE
ncbi:MAG: [Fe-Fe] hydrogenase large subunit C-terminal domain-containing protein [Bacillota bacterium]